MIDINRAGRVQERPSGGDAGVAAERARLIEELRHGANIHEVLAKSSPIVRADIERYFSDQWKNFKGQVVQDNEIKAMPGSYRVPSINDFVVHHKGATLSLDERNYFAQEMAEFMSKAVESGDLGKGSAGDAGAGSAGEDAGGGGAAPSGGKFKAQGVGKAQDAGVDEEEAAAGGEESGPMSYEEAIQATQGTVAEWEQVKTNSMDMILNAQFMHDYESRTNEIKAEVQKILAMVKSGQIGPEFALLALAKMNSTQKGVIFTHLGRRAFNVNEQMNQAYDDLKTMGSSDPNYFASLQDVQSKTRDGSFQLQNVQMTMSKAVANISEVMEFAKSAMDQISQMKMRIIQKYDVR